MLLRRYKKIISNIVKTCLSTMPKNGGVLYDELFVCGIEALYEACKKYKKDAKTSFYTYAVSVITKEISRYYVANSPLISQGQYRGVSLDSMSIEDGLSYSEIIGLEDHKIKDLLNDDEIKEKFIEEEYKNYQDPNSLAERVHLIMLELSGKNTLSKTEVRNLRRRIKYHFKKKLKR